jgi:hypothetical protein
MFMSAMKDRRVTTLPATAEGDARELTPAEIRGVLFDLARRQIDELAARPAIAALNRIMRDSLRTPLARPVE